MANVFISHRTVDMAEAERLAEDLKAAGHTVWLDKWEINIGDSIVAKMNQGLEGAVFVVICYSSAGIDSPWMSREWMSALSRQLNGHGVKVMPVMLSGGSPPAILADIRYADLASNWDSGVQALLRAMS